MPDDWTMLILICNVIYWFRKSIWWYMYMYVCTCIFKTLLFLFKTPSYLILDIWQTFVAVIPGQRLWNRWRIWENKWKRRAFKWTVSECVAMCTWSSFGRMSRHIIPRTPEISFCFIHRSMWIYFIGHVYTWKTQVCVNGWFMQRGYWNGMCNSIPGYFIDEKLWAKVSPLCTMIDANIPKRMTIKAPQTYQNHNMISILIC